MTKKPIRRRTFMGRALATVTSPLLGPLLTESAHAALHSPPDQSKGSIASQTAPLEVIALNRLAFGPRPGEIEKFRLLGSTNQKRLHAYLEQQLLPQSIDDSACEQKLNAEKFETLHKSLTELWADYAVGADKMRDIDKAEKEAAAKATAAGEKASLSPTDHDKATKRNENELRTLPANEVEKATWIRSIYSERQLFEVMVHFWHDHFSTFAYDGKIASVFAHYDRDVIRKNTFGNFREMLEDVAKSPVMLLYLDNAINQSGNPNENYARELFELHTLGAENYLGTRDRQSVPGFTTGQPAGYVDGDVYEAARCFTGWRVDQGGNSKDTGKFDYFEQWHDRFQKIVLGKHLREYQPPLKDGHDVLDMLAQHHGTARYVCRKLCRHLIGDSPSNQIVEKAAHVFHEHFKSKDQIKHVIRVIVMSPEFEATWGQKMKRPFEATVAMLRGLEADFTPSDPFLKNFERTGQKLFQWRTPDGYPDTHQKWANTNSMLERWRLTNQIMANSLSGVKINAFANIPNNTDTQKILYLWAQRFLGRLPASATDQAIASFLAGDKNLKKRIPGGLALLFMSTDFQWS